MNPHESERVDTRENRSLPPGVLGIEHVAGLPDSGGSPVCPRCGQMAEDFLRDVLPPTCGLCKDCHREVCEQTGDGVGRGLLRTAHPQKPNEGAESVGHTTKSTPSSDLHPSWCKCQRVCGGDQ